MELPADILPLIHAYAKPRLLYPEEYKAVLRAVKQERWSELMEKLSGKEANDTLSVVKMFLAADDNCKHVEMVYCRTQNQLYKIMLDLLLETKGQMFDALVIVVNASGPLFDDVVAMLSKKKIRKVQIE
jgi:cobalamin biosynthesis Co2+ chelatase CbiK